MPLDSVEFTNASKEVYEDKNVLLQQQNLKSPFFAKIKKSSQKPSIDGVFNSIIMEGDESGGAIYENESFPEANNVVTQKPKIQSKTMVAPIEVSKKAIALSESNKQAFAQALDTQIMDTRARFLSDINRQSYGTGTGEITLANGAGVATTSLVVDDPFPFRINMYIDIFQTLGGVQEVVNVRITNVNLSTKTLTLASAQTWSDNAIIAKANKLVGVTSQADAKEMMGWRGISDNGTYGTVFEGVDITQFPQFTGNVVDALAAPISEDLLQKTYNQIAVIGDAKPNMLISNYGQHRTFKNSEIQKTRYEPGEIKAGNIVMKWGELEWIVDHTAPIGEVAMLNMDGIRRYECYDVRMSDVGNGNTQFQVYGKHQIGSYFEYEGNIGVWKRNDQGRLTNLPEPTF